MSELGMNERAWAIANRYAARACDLRMGLQTLSSGARVIDAGVNVPGGLEAGTMLVELCMGGLGHVAYVPLTIGGDSWSVCRSGRIIRQRPVWRRSTGWAINPEGFFAMGSDRFAPGRGSRRNCSRNSVTCRRCLTWRAGAGGTYSADR